MYRVPDKIHDELLNWARWANLGAWPHPLPRTQCGSFEGNYRVPEWEALEMEEAPPPPKIRPNSRPHWAQLAKAKKAAREAAYWSVKATGLIHSFPDGPLHLWIDFYPPDRRKRDDDGLLSSMKAARDGIADALGLDDSRFVSHPRIHAECIRKGGVVSMRITGELHDVSI